MIEISIVIQLSRVCYTGNHIVADHSDPSPDHVMVE